MLICDVVDTEVGMKCTSCVCGERLESEGRPDDVVASFCEIALSSVALWFLLRCFTISGFVIVFKLFFCSVVYLHFCVVT